jgi:hypothetical protein
MGLLWTAGTIAIPLFVREGVDHGIEVDHADEIVRWGQWQPQEAPQPPPDGVGAGAADPPVERPAVAKTENTRRTSAWPCGQRTIASASSIDRRCSNASSQVLQRYS